MQFIRTLSRDGRLEGHYFYDREQYDMRDNTQCYLSVQPRIESDPDWYMAIWLEKKSLDESDGGYRIHGGWDGGLVLPPGTVYLLSSMKIEAVRIGQLIPQ